MRQRANAGPVCFSDPILTNDSNSSTHEEPFYGRTGFQSSVHDKFRSSNAQTYDKSLLQKLNSRRGCNISTSPRSYGRLPFSTSLNDGSPSSGLAHKHAQPYQKPLSLPVMTSKMGPLESPLSRWADGGALSVAPFSSFNGGQYGYRSPSERDDMEHSPRPYSRQTTCDFDDTASSVSHSYQGSHYPDNDSDFPMEETGLQRLRIDDNMRRSEGHSPSSAAGQKRRASSPPQDDGPPLLHTATSLSDLYRRRESASRASPAPSRHHSNHGSISSSASGPRSTSFNSVPSLAASSMSTVDSYGRLSPGGLSPGAISPRTIDSGDSAFTTAFALCSAPRESIPRTTHSVISETRPIVSAQKSIDTLNQPKSTVLKVQSGFICDCCPKKPKKFDTEDALMYV